MFGSGWICGRRWYSIEAGGAVELPKSAGGGGGDGKLKRKKLKGKRAVVRWLKLFRYKKKKEYERMTAEEKILYKLNKVKMTDGLTKL